MKISQSLLFAYAAAQGDDRWGSTDYYSFNYGFGGGKQDSGIAFGMNENPALQSWDQSPDPALQQAIANNYEFNAGSAHVADNLHFNGLLCWMCDFRLDLATEAETSSCADVNCQNAYARCLKGGMLMRCRGEQRTCMFEERRRHGVVYSVCTGCKQTDACVAHWRRNQRFTLPFMNFGDMSLRNLPTTTGNHLEGGMDQLPNHRPVYVDDECSTYQEVRTEANWRATAYNGFGDNIGKAATPVITNIGTNSEVFPMGWVPDVLEDGASAGVRLTNGLPFSQFTNAAKTVVNDLQFTGHRVNLGLSYSKFAYDGGNGLQLNAQLSQWESTCRWCCHARPDTVCNIHMGTINSSPFATKCGNAYGTRRDENVNLVNPADTKNAHPIAAILAELKTRITTDTTALVNNQFGYWELVDNTAAAGITQRIRGADLATDNATDTTTCSLSNAQWITDDLEATRIQNKKVYPQGIHKKFRFFQPFNIAQSNADYFNAVTTDYEQGPRFWMQMFQRTPQYDLSAWYNGTNRFAAKFPAVGEGRNSAGMDKFAGRGNKSRWEAANRAQMQNNPELQHFFQQQTDMVSQENRDFFDARASDARTSLASGNIYLRRYDNDHFWNQD